MKIKKLNKDLKKRWNGFKVEKEDVLKAIYLGVRAQESYEPRMVLLVAAQEVGLYLFHKYGYEIRRSITAGYVIYYHLSQWYDEVKFSMTYPRSLSFGDKFVRKYRTTLDGSTDRPSEWFLYRNEYISFNKDVEGLSIPLMKHRTVNSSVFINGLNKLQRVAYRIKRIDQKYNATPLKYRSKLEVNHSKPYYFIWQSDGCRTYPIAHQINPQGDDYRKAITLNLFKSEPLTKDGHKWVKIGIANARGLDKETFSDRIKWVEETNLLRVQDRFIESPAMYHKLVSEYLSYQGGNWDSMVGVDATWGSGQVYACLTRCLKTAFHSNLTGMRRNDVYSNHNRILNRLTGKNYKRSETKKGFMTHFYNSRRTPQRIFKSDYKAFVESANLLVPGAALGNSVLNKVWDRIKSKEVISLDIWSERFEFEQTKLEKYSWTHRGNNFTHQFYQRKVNEDWRGFSARVVHFIDGQLALKLISRCNFEVVHVHDCFYCHPNNVDRLRAVYRDIIIELYKADVLGQICIQVGIEPEYIGDLKEEHIRGEYMLS